MNHPASVYPIDADFAAKARYRSDEYERLYAESVNDPDGFLGRVAQRLYWFKAPTKINNVSYDL